MSDLLGEESTTNTSQSSNTSGSSNVNNYGSAESLAGYNSLYKALSGLTSQYSGDVTTNPTYQAGANAISNKATQNWTKSANQINDLFGGQSFWSGSAHENALESGAQDYSTGLADSLASYWTGAQTNQNNTMTSLLSLLNSLTQSNADTATNYNSNTNSTGTSTTENSGGLGDLFGTVLGYALSGGTTTKIPV